MDRCSTMTVALYHRRHLTSCLYNCRFRPVVVKELIHKVLMETLNEKQYSSEQAKTWTKEISDTIITRLKGNKVSC